MTNPHKKKNTESLRFRHDKDMPRADKKKAQLCFNLNKSLFINTISDPKASEGTR